MNKAGNERREGDDEEWDSLAILNCQWRLRDDSALFVPVEDDVKRDH